jgi:hypothetical protein
MGLLRSYNDDNYEHLQMNQNVLFNIINYELRIDIFKGRNHLEMYFDKNELDNFIKILYNYYNKMEYNNPEETT